MRISKLWIMWEQFQFFDDLFVLLGQWQRANMMPIGRLGPAEISKKLIKRIENHKNNRLQIIIKNHDTGKRILVKIEAHVIPSGEPLSKYGVDKEAVDGEKE